MSDSAFPVPKVDGKGYHPGLTKREYFSNLVMHGLVDTALDKRLERQELEKALKKYANISVLAAEALLERLN